MASQGVSVFSASMQAHMRGVPKQLREEYERNEPYPYTVIKDVCREDVMRGVRNEIIDNFEATYKETDLFKMLQSMDLANLSTLDDATKARIPNLLALRDAIYSAEFREFVSSLTGCGQLSETTDCACNIHPVGGHLLTHDDVIGDRRVSYIIYLTDPDDPWTEEDGGALELYPEDPVGTDLDRRADARSDSLFSLCSLSVLTHTHTRGARSVRLFVRQDAPMQPFPIPSAKALPIFNSMAMFKVEAGKSFHSIQEVFTSDKPRMSLQGWFHGPLPEAAGPVKALPTLAMLQASMEESDLGRFTAFQSPGRGPEVNVLRQGDATPYELTEPDVEYLSKWLNPLYLDGRGTSKLQKAFEEDGSIHLLNLLCEGKAKEIKAAMLAADAADGVGEGRRTAYEVGIGDGWTLRGPAHMQRYVRYDGAGAGGEDDGGDETVHKRVGDLLRSVYTELISSVPFANLIRTFTTLSMTGCQGEVRRFRPGLDYTVAHYGALTKDPRLDVVLTFVNDDSMSSASWADGECGGFEAYLLADEDEDGPAEVYRQVQDDDSGVLNVSAGFNALSIVLRDEGLMRFVKYVSSTAPGSRWDVSAIMLPADDSDSDDGGA